jgi:hypothetical protein
MICPRCGTQNELGARRCSNCLLAFTRGAAERDGRSGIPGQGALGPATGGWDHEADPQGAFDYPDYDAERRPRRGFPAVGCIAALGILATTAAVAVVVFLLASNLWIRPMVRDAADDDLREGVRQEVADQIATHASLSAEAGEPAAGEITITEAEINDRIDATGDLGPFDDVSVDLDDGGVTVKLRAYGVRGTYDADLRAENGTLVLDGGDIDGPLGLLAPTNDLEQAVNEEIAESLVGAGYRVDAVSVRDGELVLIVGVTGE